MNRAEGPDGPESEETPPDAPAEGFGDAETPAFLLGDAATSGGDAPRARPVSPLRPRPPVRIVGAPPAPDRVRDSAEVALRALPVAGISRRRMGWIAGFVLSVWIVAVFARQVGEASAAGARADQVRADNAALSAEVAALQHERDVVQERSFIEFQARTYGLGDATDQRFTLAQNAPSLPPDAPGSASVRLVPAPTPQTPLDSWLGLLFGPSR